MDLITAYAVYMTVTILLVGLWAVRVPHEDVKMVFILSLIWPVSITVILGMIALGAIGWDMEMAKGSKLFAFRRPNNPKVRGFAVTLLKQEFQFYSKRPKTQAEIDQEIDRLHK